MLTLRLLASLTCWITTSAANDLSVVVSLSAACAGTTRTSGPRLPPGGLPVRMNVRVVVKAPDRARVDVLSSECANQDWCVPRLQLGAAFSVVGSRSTSWYALGRTLRRHSLPPSPQETKYAGTTRPYFGNALWSFLCLFDAVAGPFDANPTALSASGPIRMPLPQALCSLSGREVAAVDLRRGGQTGRITASELRDVQGHLLAQAKVERRDGPAEDPLISSVSTELSEGIAPCLVETFALAADRQAESHGKGPGSSPGDKRLQEVQRWFEGRTVDTELTRLPEGIWVPKRATVKDLKGNLRVTAEFSNYRVNSGIPDSFFDLSTLEAQAAKAEAAKKEAGGK